MVVSPTVATILESIPGYSVSTDGNKSSFAAGVQVAGSLQNRFTVYKNPYMTENKILSMKKILKNKLTQVKILNCR